MRSSLSEGTSPSEGLVSGTRLARISQHGALRSSQGISESNARDQATATQFLANQEIVNRLSATLRKFDAPPKGFNGATGFYAGQQEMFTFLIDDSAWVEIGGEQFAPGFFVWNSEVGRRTIGVETFWFQRVCANHIVWDAIEVVQRRRSNGAILFMA